VAVKVAGVWRTARRIGDLALDRVAPRSIPLEGMTRTTMRIRWWLQLGEGRPGEAAPWWGGGVLWDFSPWFRSQRKEKGRGVAAREEEEEGARVGGK
jgi:hypothetical protein